MAEQPRCTYCGEPMLPAGTVTPKGRDHGRGSTRDHVIPKRFGGNVTVRCCRSCNMRKGSKTPTQWLAYLDKKMPHRTEAVRVVFRSLGIHFIEPATCAESQTELNAQQENVHADRSR